MLINYIRKSYDKTCLTMVIPSQVAVIIAKRVTKRDFVL